MNSNMMAHALDHALIEYTLPWHFLGADPDSIEDANFLKAKMTGNSLPPPDQGVFQSNFDVNVAELVKLVKRALTARGLIGNS